MGALAPVSSWMTDDDVLLKNAVEAGASLESLAKGAVQFSQKFTFQELQDRWCSLLYDPVVSEEASLHMIEFEHSASKFPSKFSRPRNSKENKSALGKRRAESVRNCYYALKKRICSEPFDAMNLSFLIAPCHESCLGSDHKPLSSDCMLGESVSNQFPLLEANFDISNHTFPQIGEGGHVLELDAQFKSRAQEDCTMERQDMHEEIPSGLNHIVSPARSGSVVEEFGQPNELAVYNDGGIVQECSKLDQVLSSQPQECGPSFDDPVYSSSLHDFTMWGTIQDISATDIPVDLGLREKDLHKLDTFSLHDDGAVGTMCPSQYAVVQMDSNMEQERLTDELNNANGNTEVYLVELSNTLLNFPDEDMIDHSYGDRLAEFWLSTPIDANQDHIAKTIEHKQSISQDFLIDESGGCPRMLEEDKETHHCSDAICVPEVPLFTSQPVSNMQSYLEDPGGVICCTVNTEDPEIPCNDHVVFTSHVHPKPVPSVAQRKFPGGSKPNSSFIKELPSSHKVGECLPSMQRNKKNGQSHVSSSMISLQVMPKVGMDHSVGDSRVDFLLPNNEAAQKNADFAHDSTQVNGGNGCMRTSPLTKLKGEITETAMANDLIDSCPEEHAFGSDDYRCPGTNANGVKQELHVPASIPDHQGSHAEMGSIGITASEDVTNHSLSEQEEPPVDSDDDVPYFSDIEAMILDMDLDPEDGDIYCSEEVSRFQHEDTKREIMRLEQGAHSYMQRAIASHGAFASLYGRHSKHYIRKHEVLLGRATEDVTVDIDLGREGRANKISRRQATINLDKSGSFHLKNLGKCPISVNDNEAAPGQSLRLKSNCLIEIRGMPFIFETNETCVKQYLRSMIQKVEPGSTRVE